ncbi:MAG TPA: indolepyruvate ferredoxin oxidoreductase subunit alpha [Methanocorpusculum sp.]|nr:indolepyruvate ferredoxin oxidoreductase subunit alpha [Methanocorpusculum sp.]HJJ53438.1 indolepyruvate ferredoxin oxidoreductase subunit alpha [Methanocorpusculum sp.]
MAEETPKKYLLGNDAIAHACLEAGVDFVSGYPGTPSSEVVDKLRFEKDPWYYLEWSVNEKVAFENALAASWCGLRSIVTMKHVGLNVAADPLMTSSYTGTKGGFVVLSADDPFAHSSQNEQDSRMYAKFAQIPCLDPSSAQEAHDFTKTAFELSEKFSLPVLLRPTTRICHSKGDVVLGKPVPSTRKGEFVKNPKQFVVIPAHTRPLHAILTKKQPKVAKYLVDAGLNSANIRGKKAVIAGGISISYVEEIIPNDVSFIKISAYPIDRDWLSNILAQHTEVLVVEELMPMIEEAALHAASLTVVHGKLDGYLPHEGEYSPALIAEAFEKVGFSKNTFPPTPEMAQIAVRPPILCAGCLHRSVFYAMKKVFKDGVFPSDIGCYTLGLQLGAVDTTICMGASITVGSGIAHSCPGTDVVSTIGDSTFLHTGVNGLINAVYNNANQIVIILDNRITAMTGHQPNPNTGFTATGEESPKISLEELVRACGVSYVESVDPYDLTYLLATLREAKEKPGVKVIIAKQPCVIMNKRLGIKRNRYVVDAEKCTKCGVCLKYGCPAIETDESGAAKITALCTGCGVCSDLCSFGSIYRGGSKE